MTKCGVQIDFKYWRHMGSKVFISELHYPFFLSCLILLFVFFNRDFYFHALRSLVVLSFPQLLSFSLVFPKPLSETLRRSSDGRIPI
jgi:hypothetical protein